MLPRLMIYKNVIDRLASVKSASIGYLFGLMHDGALLVIGLSIQTQDFTPPSLPDDWTKIKLHFPTEIDFCGLVTFGNFEITDELLDNLQQDIQITDNPLLLKYSSSDIKTQFYVNENLQDIKYEVLNESDLWGQFVHIRLQVKLPLSCELQADSVSEALRNIRKKIAAGMVCFHFPKSDVYLLSNDSDGLSGITGDPTVGQLCTMCDNLESMENLSDGSVKVKGKKKYSAKDVDVISVEMLMKSTKDAHEEDIVKTAPVIQHVKKNYVCLKTTLKLDGLSVVHRNSKAVRLYAVLVDSLWRTLLLTENSFLEQISKCKNLEIVSPPELYHFLPPECGHFLTVIYPKKQSDSELVEMRNSLHQDLCLPSDKPYFRRGCVHLFASDIQPNAPLLNVHLGLTSHVKGGEVSLLQGTYSYHHYKQDRLDDSGWGCAYRSLQTIVSWFRWQGYTEHPVPTHKEIQQCLVKIGDKPSSFVGSTQWIGSTEVSFCLETMLGISSRILSVSSGEELGSRGSELAYHFKNDGTPIMIGGGVLAHTILGVDFNKDTGDLKFLILDPHYTGGEDLQIIQGKGWCGWKGVEFWKKGAYYNLCLPQRPRCL